MVRIACLLVVSVVVVSSAFAAAGVRQPPGMLSVEGGRGVVIIRGNGGLLGRVAQGSVIVVDLSPSDPWRWSVNGIARERRATLKRSELSFRILGGSYRLTVAGEGISISARGTGVATLTGHPGLTGDTGLYAAGLDADCDAQPDQCQPIPIVSTRVPFGEPATAVR